jgi:hypothetical protein
MIIILAVGSKMLLHARSHPPYAAILENANTGIAKPTGIRATKAGMMGAQWRVYIYILALRRARSNSSARPTYDPRDMSG